MYGSDTRSQALRSIYQSHNHLIMIGLVLFALTACGGGGGGGDNANTHTNHSPTAIVSEGISTLEQQYVTLHGKGTDPDNDIDTYQWEQLSGTAIELKKINQTDIQFFAPAVSKPTQLKFQLKVTDHHGSSSSTAIDVTVQPDPNLNSSPQIGFAKNQTAMERQTITYLALATDPDGEIESYQWTQLNGPSVVAGDLDQAELIITTPDADSLTSPLRFQLKVVDNEGAQSTRIMKVYIVDELSQTNISGVVTFDRIPHSTNNQGLDYSEMIQSPAKYVTIEAVSSNHEILSQTQTDSEGYYSLDVPMFQSIRLRVSAKSVVSESYGWDLKVVDNTQSQAVYALEGKDFNSGSTPQIRDLHADSGWNGTDQYSSSRSAAPFAILDTIHTIMEGIIADVPDVFFPSLIINWSPDNAPIWGNLDQGHIGTSFYSGSNIYLLGYEGVDTDEYDEHLIAHEWGHYFLDHFSRDDSLGGSHALSDKLDMRVAFSEGFATAFAGLSTGNSEYKDSIGINQGQSYSFNIEAPDFNYPKGWYNETAIAALIYNLFDAGNENEGDIISLGFKTLFDTLSLTLPKFDGLVSIFPLLSSLSDQHPGSQAEIAQLASFYGINSLDPFGDDETNTGNGDNSLPVYHLIEADGESLQACSSKVFGTYNKLSNRKFIRLSVPSKQNYVFTLSGPSNSDPEFVLYRRGKFVGFALSPTPGTEQLTTQLTPGEYIIETYEYQHVNPQKNTSSASEVCFQMAVTNA